MTGSTTDAPASTSAPTMPPQPSPAGRETDQSAGAPPGKLGKPEFIAIIAMLMALNALAIDIILPAIPRIGAAVGVSDDAQVAQLLVTYIFGFGLAQPFYGPISDRFGRILPLYIGGGIYIACALLALFAQSLEQLLVLRFLQGMGAAATRVIGLAIVRDCMSGRHMASTMSLVMMVFMIVPIFAPMFGEGLLLFGSWQLVFGTMAILCGATLLWVKLRLPETLPKDARRPLTFASSADAFRMIVTNRLAFFYALGSACSFSSLFSFLTLAQPIYVGVYDLGKWFTIAFAGVAVLMAVTAFANSRLVIRLGQRHLSHGALIAFFGLALVMLALSWGGNPSFWVFYGLMAIIMPLFGLIGANLNSIAMQTLGQVAGSASALFGFMQSVIGGLAGALVAGAFEGELRTFAIGLCVASGSAIVCLLVAERGKLFGTSEDA